jgi:DNA-binding MarR family transcriptional regulator
VKLEDAIQSNKFKNPQQKATLNCLYTAWWLRSVLSKELKTFDLTHEQYNVLRILKGKHPEQMCVKDIAGRMMEKSSNVPRIVDRLVAKKWVKRSTSAIDKRETVITLTQSGINVLGSSTNSIEHLFNRILTLNDSEANQLNDLLEKLRQHEG